MKNKYEKNANGVEYLIETYHPNGKLYFRYEWNASRTKTSTIETYYPNGRLKTRYEWNSDQTETDLVESYHEEWSLKTRFEWNASHTETFLVERFDEYGNLTEKRIWNEDRTDLDLAPVRFKMEIKINNKTYFGKYNENGKLIIPLNNDEDIIYFQQWISTKKDVMLKSDYVRNFDFTNGYEKGTLCNCQPILSKNLDCVELLYDYNSGHLELPCS
jgi:hypothetical protein